MSEDLQKLRAQMDGIDNEIARLLKDRAATAIEIGRQKKRGGVKSYADFARQEKILKRLQGLGGQIDEKSMRAIYRQIISACLACEQTQKIAYLGPGRNFQPFRRAGIFWLRRRTTPDKNHIFGGA